MNFFSRLFGGSVGKGTQPNIKFGRYTDSYKESTKYDSWDEAIDHFEKKEFLACYQSFFEYLRDEQVDNVQFEQLEHEIRFRFYQGSKEISGFANRHKLKAESKIARTSQLNVGFLRRLVENNYNLKYGRYCIDKEGDISIVFDTLSLDASPYKIYYALKEIALASDKQDDLLVEEFESLQRVNTDHITQLEEPEKEVKVDYLKQSIEDTLQLINQGKLDSDKYPSAVTYLLLELVYRLDFLVRPEGATMEAFERMHRFYFAIDNLSAREKNQKLVKELTELQQRPREKIKEELYNTISTFGITNPSTHQRFREFVMGEIGNSDWYEDNGHPHIALAITGYIAGYCLFYYSLTRPDRDLLLLYFQILHQPYFESLGFQLPYIDEKSRNLNRAAIKQAINQILTAHRNRYPKMSESVKQIDYSNTVKFAKSFLTMVAGLDQTESS